MSCDPVASGFQLTESYVLGPGGEELTQLDGNNQWQRTNVYGAGKLLATYDLVNSQPALHFQLTDPLGTRRMQTSAVGQPETDIQSLPFGDLLNSFPDQYAPATADDATPLHFTGKERDSESGNDYFGARYYASTMGRFLSPDYQDLDDGDTPEAIPNGTPSSPQSLNLYAFTSNNPLSRRDYDGHASWQDCGDGSGSQCWRGDYNGERDCSGSSGCLFWNSGSGQWQPNDPTPPPADIPLAGFVVGLGRTMSASSGADFRYGVGQMASGIARDFFTLGAKSAAALVPFGRPSFVPKNWVEKEPGKGRRGGIKFEDPNNPHNWVRIMEGQPGNSNPGQQVDNMTIQRNGVRLGADGNPVDPADPLAGHIPLGTQVAPDIFEPLP